MHYSPLFLSPSSASSSALFSAVALAVALAVVLSPFTPYYLTIFLFITPAPSLNSFTSSITAITTAPSTPIKQKGEASAASPLITIYVLTFAIHHLSVKVITKGI